MKNLNNTDNFTNSDPFRTKVEEVTCRMCEKVFPIDVQYGKDGLPRFFRPKYCNECNAKLKINNTNGTAVIGTAKVPKESVEGLVNDLNAHTMMIKEHKLDLDVFKSFKSAQTYFNDDQIGINLAHFTLIKEIHKTLIIGFSVLVVFMLVTWGYLTYTFFNH